MLAFVLSRFYSNVNTLRLVVWDGCLFFFPRVDGDLDLLFSTVYGFITSHDRITNGGACACAILFFSPGVNPKCHKSLDFQSEIIYLPIAEKNVLC